MPPRNRQPLLKKQILTIALLGCSFVLFIVSHINPKATEPLVDTVNTSLYQLVEAKNNILDSYYSYLHSKSYILALQNRNKLLQDLVNKLRADNLNITYLRNQNQELKKLLNIQPRKGLSLSHVITAHVYFQNLLNHIDSLMVNVGLQQGVQDFAPVFFNGALVGSTYHTANNTCDISLITSPTSRVPVYSNQSHLNAIMIGDSSDQPLLINYHKHSSFIEGEKLLTSGLGKLFPRNLPIGTITKINGVWRVNLYNNLHELSYVNILASAPGAYR